MSDTRTTPEAAEALLRLLALRYAPRPMPWSAQDSADGNLATAALWVQTMGKYPAETVAAAVERVCIDRPDWAPNLNEFDRILYDAHKAARQTEARQRGLDVPPSRRCDGSGWVQPPEGAMVPCRWCNPFLHSEHDSGRLHDWGPQREDRRKQWERDNVMPTPCRPAADPMALPVPPEQGRALAWAAYRDACTAQGRTPDPKTLARLLGGTINPKETSHA